MDSAEQVIFVLQVVLGLGPIAVYFLGLGLVNSQAHPCLVNSRVDFTLLAIAFFPLVVWPVVALVERGLPWLAAGVVILAAGLFFAVRPDRQAAWVVYNISPQRCQELIERVCRRLGWRFELLEPDRPEAGMRIEPVGLVLTQDAFCCLRNVTVRICLDKAHGPSARNRFIEAFEAELGRQYMLPSATGASLVFIGAALLGVPMWYLVHHMTAIVDVVSRVLLA